jgi:hypothetical protein
MKNLEYGQLKIILNKYKKFKNKKFKNKKIIQNHIFESIF